MTLEMCINLHGGIESPTMAAPAPPVAARKRSTVATNHKVMAEQLVFVVYSAVQRR